MTETSPSGAALPTDWRRWVLGARPRTLPAAVAPVVVGTAAAAGDCGPLGGSASRAESVAHTLQCLAAGRTSGLQSGFAGSGPVGNDLLKGLTIWTFLCALGVAVFVQIATNYANDYSDGKRGTDDPGARVGPPRLVGNGLATPGEVKRAMLIAFGLTALCGLPLVVWVDWKLVLVGIAAIAAGWFYTGGSRPYGYAGFGEVFVFVFFVCVRVVLLVLFVTGVGVSVAFAAAPTGVFVVVCHGCCSTQGVVQAALSLRRESAGTKEAILSRVARGLSPA